jgi:hypothetical protein
MRSVTLFVKPFSPAARYSIIDPIRRRLRLKDDPMPKRYQSVEPQLVQQNEY